MRDVEKTSMQHGTNARRDRRRKRGRSLYVLMVLILAAAAIITLSMTFFFNIKTIRVTGNADSYNVNDIVDATGIQVGDNMIRMNVREAEEKALASLIYVEHVDITRQFPNTLEIHVEKCTPAYNVVYEFGTLIVSEHGRILEDSMDPAKGLVKILGYDPEETTPGQMIAAKEERSDRIFTAFRDLIYQGGLGVPIVSVDLTNFNDIMVNFDNRIIFDMGNWSEIDYKISFAEQIISEQPADKEGYLIMVGSHQCSFRNKADYEATQKKLQERSEGKGSDEISSSRKNPDDTEETRVSSADAPEEVDAENAENVEDAADNADDAANGEAQYFDEGQAAPDDGQEDDADNAADDDNAEEEAARSVNWDDLGN